MQRVGNRSGYTLLEILLVLAILAGGGFYLLVQIPHDLRAQSIEISSQKLVDDLRETQQKAITANVWHRVEFYPATGEYKIFEQGKFLRSVFLPEGVSFANNPDEVMFLPTGTPSPGMTVTLKAGDLERNIVIAVVTGRIRLEIVR